MAFSQARAPRAETAEFCQFKFSTVGDLKSGISLTDERAQ